MIKNIPPSLMKKDLKGKLAKICQKSDVLFMALFGSYMRGEQKKKSDVDLLVEYRKGIPKSLLDLIGLEEELSALFGKKIDLLTIGGISPYLKDEILNSMKVIYERK